jgi:hypothetical protein
MHGGQERCSQGFGGHTRGKEPVGGPMCKWENINLLAAIFKYPQSSFTYIFLRQPLKFFHMVYKKPLYYVNRTRLNNELSGILWEVRQRCLCISLRKQVFLFHKRTK